MNPKEVDDLFDIDPKMEAILSKLFNITPEENDKEDCFKTISLKQLI